MPKASPITTAFNAGELSQLLDGRVDLNKYGQGAHRLRNFIPTVQGPLERRAGTRFLDYCATSAATTAPSLLVDFVPSSSRPFALEFAAGDLMYVWYNGGRVLLAGTPISFSYAAFMSASALYRSDFTVAVDWAQSADVMYMTVPGGLPMKVSRLSDTSWTLTQFNPDNGPWRDPNAVKSTTIYASAQTGSVTLTASTGIFTSAMVGMLVRIEQQDLTTIKPWEPGQKNITVGVLRRSDGKTYKATSLAVAGQPPFPAGGGANKWTQTGSVKPIHTEGKAWDGGADSDFVPGATTDWYTKGVEWQFEDAGYGVARITAFTNSTTVTATVITQLPAALVGAPGASWKWEFGAWASDAGGVYPSCVCFFRERLTFLGGTRGWCSVVGDFENFSDKEFGEVLADSAVTFPLLADQANDVQWCCASDVLYVGTTGGEFVVQAASQNEAFGPANIKVSEQTSYGSSRVRPIKVGQSTIFTQRGGRVVRELAYDFGTDSFRSNDITVLAEHVTLGGLRGAAFSRNPDPIVWYVRGDGSLIGLTYNKEQDVVAWHPHPLGANPFTDAVQCVCTIPSVIGPHDDLYVVMRRLEAISLTPRYTVERLEQPHKETNLLAASVYSDSALIYQGAPATVISGLSHIKNREVTVLADGAAHPNVLVNSGGSIDLNRAASTVVVGLPMISEYEGMRLEAGAADGTAQGKTKRITRLAIRFYNTLGGMFGFLGKQLDTIQFRSGNDPMDSAPPLFTGDKSLLFPDGYDTDARIYIKQDQPLPMTIVAVMPQVNTEDRG